MLVFAGMLVVIVYEFVVLIDYLEKSAIQESITVKRQFYNIKWMWTSSRQSGQNSCLIIQIMSCYTVKVCKDCRSFAAASTISGGGGSESIDIKLTCVGPIFEASSRSKCSLTFVPESLHNSIGSEMNLWKEPWTCERGHVKQSLFENWSLKNDQNSAESSKCQTFLTLQTPTLETGFWPARRDNWDQILFHQHIWYDILADQIAIGLIGRFCAMQGTILWCDAVQSCDASVSQLEAPFAP